MLLYALINGNFVVAWHTGRKLHCKILKHRFLIRMVTRWNEFTANIYRLHNGYKSSKYCATSDGGFVLAWSQKDRWISRSIVIRKFDAPELLLRMRYMVISQDQLMVIQMKLIHYYRIK